MPQLLRNALSEPGSRPERWLASIVTAAALALLGVQAAQLTWQVWPRPDPSAPPAREAADIGEPSQRIDITSVVQAKLFGDAEQTASTSPPPDDAPETQLDLALKGVLAGTAPGRGLAIIARGGGADRLYRVGDDLPGGATVDAVYRDRVLLRRNGRREALPLPEDELSAAIAGDDADDNDGDRAASTLARYRARLRNDPGALQSLLQPAPVRDSAGNLTGFRIRGGESELFQATGLEPGDVVTAVDDIRLDDQRAAMQAMQRLGNAARVTLSIRRNGNQRRVRLNFGNQ